MANRRLHLGGRLLRANVRPMLTLVAVLALAACSQTDPASQYQADSVALSRGEAVFVGTCGGYCHAVNTAVGDVPNLFDCEWVHGGSNREIFNTITNGVAGSRMVAFGGRLPEGDDDIWKIIAFLKSEATGC